LGEYANMILLSAMGAVLFLGGWMSPVPYPPFTWVPGLVWCALKIAFVLFVFSWTKGTLPRYRYDQLMRLGWKVFLPVSLGWVVITAAVLELGGWVPKLQGEPPWPLPTVRRSPPCLPSWWRDSRSP